MTEPTIETARAQGPTGTYRFSASTNAPLYPFHGHLDVSWSINAGRLTLTTSQYMIDKANNEGGNNANINITLRGNPRHGPSKGDCIQDARWHAWVTSTSSAIVGGYMDVDVEFIFDKSWANDPKVTKRLSIYP